MARISFRICYPCPDRCPRFWGLPVFMYGHRNIIKTSSNQRLGVRSVVPVKIRVRC